MAEITLRMYAVTAQRHGWLAERVGGVIPDRAMDKQHADLLGFIKDLLTSQWGATVKGEVQLYHVASRNWLDASRPLSDQGVEDGDTLVAVDDQRATDPVLVAGTADMLQLQSPRPTSRDARGRGTTLRILAVFANPKGSDPLRLGSEDRVIRECIQLGRQRESLQLTVLHAATINDLRRAFLNSEYDVLHFSGHGTGQGLALEDEVGEVKLVPPKALARLCADYSPPLQCVLLNACYSKSQAKLVSDGVPFTIGMKSAISDAGAIEFTRGFYDALGAGKGFGRAFKEGSRSLDLSGCDKVDKPVCFGVDKEGCAKARRTRRCT